jgi:hypothetical protein
MPHSRRSSKKAKWNRVIEIASQKGFSVEPIESFQVGEYRPRTKGHIAPKGRKYRGYLLRYPDGSAGGKVVDTLEEAETYITNY